jgi:hypothetical protein
MGTQSAIDEVDIRRRIEASEVKHGLPPIVRPGVLRHNNNCQSLTLRTLISSDFLAIIRYRKPFAASRGARLVWL